MTANSEVERSAELLLGVVNGLLDDSRQTPERNATLDSSLERDLGLDSLARVELLLRIERALKVSLPERALADAETPRDLLRMVRSGLGTPQALVEREIRRLAPGGDTRVPTQALTLLDAFDWHLGAHPDRLQVLLYGDAGEESLSYAAIRDGAREFSAFLVDAGLAPGQAVAIMLPTCREYLFSFLGTLMAGGIPVPLYPPARLAQIEDHMRRHVGILNSARAALLITVPEAKTLAWLLRSQVQSLSRILTPAELARGGGAFTPHAAAPGDMAFLQYTSGSTGDPKGVVLTHANLLANIRAMGQAAKATGEDVFVSWLPLYHDMGLIGAWFTPMYFGFPLVLMSPLAMLSRPSRWLWAIHRHRGSISGGPNFAFDLCLKRIEDAEIEGLDLSSWRFVFNGAEPVSPETLDAFERRFGRFGLRPEAIKPVYGLAEASVGLAFTPVGEHWHVDAIDREEFARSGRAVPVAPADARALKVVCCGRTIAEHELRVVDAAGIELPERHEGRLQFRGPSATSGYYRNAGETGRLFAGEWLETGDLAYLANAELYLTGRAKDIIIRGGRNVYPYELEEAVGKVPGVRKGCVAVFGTSDPHSGTERVVVLAETREADAQKRQMIRRRINELAMERIGMPADDVVLAPPHTVLKTSSGKIRRAASREFYERGARQARPLPVWLQLARLAWAGFLPQLRRGLRAAQGMLFSARVWALLGLLTPITMALVAIPRKPAWGWRAAGTAMRLLFRLGGIPVVVRGLESLPDRPCVLVANHSSYLDGGIVVAAFPWRSYCFAAKRELRDNLFTRRFVEGVGADFVERFDARRGVEDTGRFANAVQEGRSPIVFAEGTLTRITGLAPFRMGAFVVAAQVGVPVVPVAIRGARSVLRDGSWFFRRGAIAVTVLAPIAPEGSDFSAAVALRNKVRAEILRHCGEPDLAR